MTDAPKRLDFDELFPGRFLKAGLFKGREVTLTVKAIRIEALPQDKGGEKEKGIVSFVERPKELVLNRTNGESIKAMFGRDTSAWVGKRVTFFPSPIFDNFTKQQSICIRVLGSPDLPADMQFELRLPRKKPIPTTLKRTPVHPPARGAPAPAGAPPPPPLPSPPAPSGAESKDDDFFAEAPQ